MTRLKMSALVERTVRSTYSQDKPNKTLLLLGFLRQPNLRLLNYFSYVYPGGLFFAR